MSAKKGVPQDARQSVVHFNCSSFFQFLIVKMSPQHRFIGVELGDPSKGVLSRKHVKTLLRRNTVCYPPYRADCVSLSHKNSVCFCVPPVSTQFVCCAAPSEVVDRRLNQDWKADLLKQLFPRVSICQENVASEGVDQSRPFEV